MVKSMALTSKQSATRKKDYGCQSTEGASSGKERNTDPCCVRCAKEVRGQARQSAERVI
jgi:hypothetical protein